MGCHGGAGLDAAGTCQLCPPGSYSGFPGANQEAVYGFQASCVLCPRGSYTQTYNNTYCAQCPIGSASSVLGSNSSETCVACEPGFYADTPGMSSCLPCAAGTYVNGMASTQCNTCQSPYGPSGAVGSTSFAQACQLCGVGTARWLGRL